MKNFRYVYVLKINVEESSEEDRYLKMQLAKCLGRRIRSLVLINCYCEVEFDIVSKLVQGIEICKLKISILIFSDYVAKYAVQCLKTHDVNELCLEIGSNTTTSQEKVLLEFASLVRSMHYSNHLASTNQEQLFLGINHDDDAQTIVDMFGRKLDKLVIERFYLRDQGVNQLVERLPKLGKKLWFVAPCRGYPNVLDAMDHEHLVKTDGNAWFRHLRIKHCSRLYEEDNSTRHFLPFTYN
ncbi:hypothetical protein PENTCL1PPCAC_7782 [Pristionchus entomophagus]|uniref:Uncharacterized protein n=1 Tax=Pristionchus entomophagus TaxID=358040 RepID=A0AAV5ST26_9BILA|nr:hypothetical protein PENTCL1PPCAC_7782 [Pristionchus entomophagus]